MAMESRMMLTVSIGFEENGGIRLDSLQVRQIDLIPDVFRIILVKSLNETITLRVSDGRKDQLRSDGQSQAQHFA